MTNTDITFDGSIATWTLPPTDGEVQGTYTGTFQFRAFLDPIRQLQAGREYRELLGPNGGMAAEHEGQMAFCLTQLKHRIIKAPPFWTSTLQDSSMAGNIPDLNILLIILDASIRSENAYKEKVAKERELALNRSIGIVEKILEDEAKELDETE